MGSVDVNRNNAESVCPKDMYSWRVDALDKWIAQKEKDGKLTMEELCFAGHLDQYHYLGLDSNDDIITLLQCSNKSQRLLDVGSGIGGPGRYIAWKAGCSVCGVDIQGDLVDSANRVAGAVNMGNQCEFLAQDCTTTAFQVPDQAFDAFYSVLVFLHIPREPRVQGFKNIASALKPGGAFVIEDYLLLRDTMDAEEKDLLENVIGAVYVPTVGQYKEDLESAGFTDLEFEDLTAVWTKWTELRRDRFVENREAQVSLQGEESTAKMEAFYRAPPRLFGSGKLGGFRITGSWGKKNDLLQVGRAKMREKATNELSLAQVEKILDSQKTVSV